MRNIVAEHYERMTDDQRRVLEALAVYNKPVPVAAISYLLEPFFADVDVPACLRALVLNYFVTYQRERDTYELHSLDREYAYSCIPEEGDYTKRMLHRRAAEFCLSQLTGNERQDVEWQLQGWEHWFKAAEYEAAAKLVLVISRKLREWGRYAQIVDLYRATVRTARQCSPNLLAIAIDCLGMMGRMEEQEALLEQSANSIDQHTRGLVLELTARYHADRGNDTAAVSVAEESLSILLGLVKESSPHLREQLKLEVTQAAHTVAWVFYQQGLYDEAMKRFEKGHCLMNELSAEGIIRPYQYYLADSLRMVGLHAQARSVMESRVLKMDEERIPPAAFMVWGQILQDEGDYEGAWRTFKRSQTIAKRRSSPNALSRIEWVMGKWYLLNEQFDLALKCYLYARDLFEKWGWRPRFAMVMQEIGFVQHHLCNLPEARRCYEEALALDITSANYGSSVRLGILCLGEGKVEEAQEHFARGITLCGELLEKTPRLYNVLYHLGLAQLGSGESDEAFATYRQALEVCSAKGVVQEALMDLRLLERVAGGVEGLEQALVLLKAVVEDGS
jgi:tetratricopeptide (TPR) repeat protein